MVDQDLIDRGSTAFEPLAPRVGIERLSMDTEVTVLLLEPRLAEFGLS